MRISPKIAIIHSSPQRSDFPTYEQYLTEKDAAKEAAAVAKNIRKLNIRKIVLYPANDKLAWRLREDKPDLVFNFVGSVHGKEYLAASVPGILEYLGIPYVGAGILGESLAYNKFLVHKLLQQHGIPVPNYQLFVTAKDQINNDMRFPLISKLNEIHGAVEITSDAISENDRQLRTRLKYLIKTYRQPILVEEFIVGREITVIVLEGKIKKIYCAEKVFHNGKRQKSKYIFATFESQWQEKGLVSFHYRRFDDTLLKEYIRRAFDVCKMDDYGKFDVRMDRSGRFFFLDANTNPAFGPLETDCALAHILNLYNIPFTDVLKRVITNYLQ